MDAFHVLPLKINNEGLTQAPKKENREDTSGIRRAIIQEVIRGLNAEIMRVLPDSPTKFQMLSASNPARVQIHHDLLELRRVLFSPHPRPGCNKHA